MAADGALWRRMAARVAGGGRRRTIPFRAQSVHAECGAACLAMVLDYHGRALPLEEVRHAVGADRNGSSAQAILAAARWYGMRARGLKLEGIADLRHLQRGAILHWEFAHFVVFDGRKGRQVRLLDPARGVVLVDEAEFSRAFTGIALALEPGPDFVAEDRRHRSRSRYIAALGEQAPTLRRAVAVSVLYQLLALAPPIAIGVVVDRIVPQADRLLWWILLGGMGLVLAYRALASLLRGALLLRLRTALDLRLTASFVEHLVRLPYAFFEQRQLGDLLQRLNSNAIIRDSLTTSALSALLDSGLLLLYLAAALFVDWRIGLLMLALGLLRVGVFLAMRGRLRTVLDELLQAQARAQGHQVQMLHGMETLKAAGREQVAAERFADVYVEQLNVSIVHGRLTARIDAAFQLLTDLAPLAVLLAGALLVIAGDLSLGSMIAVVTLAGGFFVPLAALVQTGLDLLKLGSYVERVNEVYAADAEQVPAEREPAPRLQGRISLQDVAFRYGPSSPPVLRGVSLEIAPGQMVAIVGASGSGKSTLARLLLGLYAPSEGRVRYDGQDLARLELQGVRNQLGVVMQGSTVFGASIQDNIAGHDRRVSLSQVIEAARLASIHDDILAMPMGYQTVLSDYGQSLSGGQRQRLALARALCHRPRILLLDEATSALDAVNEAAIQGALRQLRMTRIVIAHRLSTVVDADQIVVLERGELVDAGRHDVLLGRCAQYAHLVGAQRVFADAGAPPPLDRRETHPLVQPAG